MPLNPAYEGRTYPPTPPYAVGREAVRAFAAATGATSPLHHDVEAARAAGFADVVAPPTYAVVIAQRAEAQLVTDPEAGVDYSRVVHAEEKFAHRAPIVAGEEIVATLHVDRAREVGGHGMLTTRCELSGPDGPCATVTSTLVIRGEEA